MKKFGVVFFALLWLVAVAVSWAEASEEEVSSSHSASRSPAAANAGPQNGDEYNFNWLDPEKKIYVLQNRRYTKANRLLLSAMAGPGSTNAYRTTYGAEPRIAYYFSELLGIETFYTAFSNSENNTFEALKVRARNTLPYVREIRSEYGALLHYAPWYAKINVFNKILYFDWYFSGGAGIIHTALDTRSDYLQSPQYEEKDFTGFFLGTGHQYHLNQNFIVRLDFTGAFYRAPLMGNSGDSTWFSHFLFGVGLGFKL